MKRRQGRRGNFGIIAALSSCLCAAAARPAVAQAVVLAGGAVAQPDGLRALVVAQPHGGYDLYLQLRAPSLSTGRYVAVFAVDPAARNPTTSSGQILVSVEDATRPSLRGCASHQFGCATRIDAPGDAAEETSFKPAALESVQLVAANTEAALEPSFAAAGVSPSASLRAALDAAARGGSSFLVARVQAGNGATATPLFRVTVPGSGPATIPLHLELMQSPLATPAYLQLLVIADHRVAPQSAPVVQLDRSKVTVAGDGTSNYAQLAAAAQPATVFSFLEEFANLLVLDAVRLNANDPVVQAVFASGPRFATRLTAQVNANLLAGDALSQADTDDRVDRELDACHGGPQGCGSAPGAAVSALWPLALLAASLRLRGRKNPHPPRATIG